MAVKEAMGENMGGLQGVVGPELVQEWMEGWMDGWEKGHKWAKSGPWAVLERNVGEGKKWFPHSEAGSWTWVTHSLIMVWKLWVLLLQSSLLAGTSHVPHELVIKVEHKPNYTLLNTYFYTVLY